MGTVTSFKYLGAVVSDDGSKPEVLSRIAQANAALTKLKPIWRDNNISLGSKVKLMCSLVISIFMYACESWTLTAELEKRMQAFEMRCYRRLLNISYKDHVTNEEVRRKISHSSKVMLKVILNRLKPQAEEIIAEEQAGFRAGRSTTEKIFNLRILCEKYLQHQQNLYHVFIDFKKTFDRVWYAALWATMRKYNISANLVRTIEQLYDKATSAVQMNGSMGEWFRTTVGVRQGCLLSPTLFNIFLEWIMSDALEEHDGKVSTGGRNITNLRFADDIDALAEEEQELEALVESLDKTCTRYKMEISAEKTKLMTNSANGIQREIR